MCQASGNLIDTLRDLEPQLAHIKSLETIYLEGNPVQKSEGTAYRRKIMIALPDIKQIDATYVYPSFVSRPGVRDINASL